MAIFDPETATLLPVGQDGVPRAGVDDRLATTSRRASARAGALRDDGRWLLRGGYGLFYDSGTLIENSALYFNPPYFDAAASSSRPVGRRRPPIRFPTGRGFAPPPSVNTLAPDFPHRATRSRAASASRRASRGMRLSARGGSASHGDSLVRKRNINQPPPGPAPVDERRPIPGYGDILLVEPAASSSYHALQLRAERPHARGLWLRGAYTWGKSIDDAVGVSRQRRQRQHAAGQPQPRSSSAGCRTSTCAIALSPRRSG